MTEKEKKGNIITDEGSSRISNLKESVDKKFGEVNLLLFTVVIILLVMVATMVIDSFHFNSATYQEYSEKIQTLNTVQATNQILLEQNKDNQELIFKQQGQILKMLQEKTK